MRRIGLAVVLSLSVSVAPLAPDAQVPATQRHRIGFLNAARPGGPESVLREALRSLGYVEGANLVIDAKAAHGIVERLPALTRELLDAKPEVIVAFSTTAAQAAKAATTTTPIVMAFAGDPVGTRLVSSLTLVLNGMLTLAMAQHLFAEGRILAVGWQQGTVLLETHKGFSLVAVDPAAKIEDRLGTGRSLTDLQPGDVVECRIEPFAGIPIAEEIHVLSGSLGDQRSEDRRR